MLRIYNGTASRLGEIHSTFDAHAVHCMRWTLRVSRAYMCVRECEFVCTKSVWCEPKAGAYAKWGFYLVIKSLFGHNFSLQIRKRQRNRINAADFMQDKSMLLLLVLPSSTRTARVTFASTRLLCFCRCFECTAPSSSLRKSEANENDAKKKKQQKYCRRSNTHTIAKMAYGKRVEGSPASSRYELNSTSNHLRRFFCLPSIAS